MAPSSRRSDRTPWFAKPRLRSTPGGGCSVLAFLTVECHFVEQPALDFPVYDADNHMYETPDAFTKYLPREFDGLIKYVEVKGRTKIALRNVVSDYIPNPTFEVVARPGAQQDYFKHGNPEGKSRREMLGEPMRSIDAYFAPEPRLALMNELGIDRA